MEFKYIIHEYLSICGGFKGVFQRTKMIILGKENNQNHYDDLYSDLGNPTMKSIEMLFHTTKVMGKCCSSPVGFNVSPLCH
jgi:hypothetical protein